MRSPWISLVRAEVEVHEPRGRAGADDDRRTGPPHKERDHVLALSLARVLPVSYRPQNGKRHACRCQLRHSSRGRAFRPCPRQVPRDTINLMGVNR